MLEVGETVERYRVEAVLGAGVLATVYRVRHLQLDTVHALKVLTASTPSDRARLFAEGQIQAKLRHPNVVGVSDVLLVNRTPALVLELVDGPSLQRWLERCGTIPLRDALSLFRGIVSGVGVAHAAGLVHRDLKPSNVLLGRGRTGGWIAKVTDFGLVRVPGSESPLTRSGTAIGAPAYTAPEQIRNPGAVDARADLWALGCVLYELVSGARAFPQTEPLALYEAVAAARYVDLAKAEPEPPAPVRVTDVIRDLLRTDPNARIVSCAHLWERLWDDPVPAELHVGDRLLLEVPVALEPPVPLSVSPDLTSLAEGEAGLDAPPTLVPFDEEITLVADMGSIEAGIAALAAPAAAALEAPDAVVVEAPDAVVVDAPAAVVVAPIAVDVPDPLAAPAEARPGPLVLQPTPPPVSSPPRSVPATPSVPSSARRSRDPFAERPLWAWPAGFAAAVAVAAVPMGLLLLGVGYPESVRGLPEPAPRVALVTPEPEPVPVPVPVPVVPAPEVVPAPAPVTAAATPRPRSTGTVSVEGDATDVWLDAAGKRIEARGQVPAGRYVVRASFGDGLSRKAGEIQVRPGAETRVRCASFVYACTEVHRNKKP